MKTVTMEQRHIEMLDAMRGRASRKTYVGWLVMMEHMRRKLDPDPQEPPKPDLGEVHF